MSKYKYSQEQKTHACISYLSGEKSALQLALELGMSKYGRSTIRGWVKRYQAHGADTLKTTYAEKIEIVNYCLAHDRDIKETAVKYGCNYAQLYQWIRKYESNGEVALIDKRGKRKEEDELTALEKA